MDAVNTALRDQPNETRLKKIAAGYVEEIARRSNEIENARKLPQDIADRMSLDGLYHVCTPREYGGSGLSPRTYAEIVEILAGADASAAWCAFIGITSSFSMASGQTDSIKSLLNRPGVITSGVFAPNGRAAPATRDGIDGYIVTGRWQWGSGSQNAHFVCGGAFISDDGGQIVPNEHGQPEHLTVIFEAGEVELFDTWNVMGLSGSGSTDYAVNRVFVPAERTIRRFGSRQFGHPIFLFPNFGMLAIGIGAVALGAAQSSLNDFLSFAGQKVAQGTTRVLAEKQSTQKDVGRAYTALRAGRAFFYQAIDDAWTGALSGELGVEQRRDVRLASTQAVRSAKECIDIVFELAGGTAVYSQSPMQRRFRDVRVAGQHMMVNPATFELAGRLLLELPTNIDQL